MTPYEKVQHCLAQVKKACPEKPKVGIVLGSGLGDLADAVEDAVYVPLFNHFFFAELLRTNTGSLVGS